MKTNELSRKIANLFWLPFGLLIGLPVFVILGIAAVSGVLWLWLDEIRVQMKMHRDGRSISRSELTTKTELKAGTLILESTTLGWGWARLWWTEDDILSHSPISILNRGIVPDYHSLAPEQEIIEYQFTKWAHHSYTDLRSGKACLVRGMSGFKRAFHFSQKSSFNIVHIWTANIPLWALEFESESFDQQKTARD